MKVTMRDGDLLTCGDIQLYRIEYSLYQVNGDVGDNKNYTLLGTVMPKNHVDTTTFIYQDLEIEFAPLPLPVYESVEWPEWVEAQEEELWKS